ncbi:MAG TPA: beta-ketoacyl synthase chain length factor, partial [Polyangiales bacterium]|nr:beta-ketoacyl synthase chain length factor [Polyangiales bacterium]
MKVLGAGYVTTVDKLELALLERTLRRGLSEVTKLFMHAAKLALDDAALDAHALPVIFASAFGEIAVAEALLAEAFERDGSSPARFRNSVHNTALGLLSISQRNTAPSTAIAAGWDTVP